METLKQIASTLLQDVNWPRTIRKKEYKSFRADIVSATSFLPANAVTYERLYVLANDICQRPICPQCNVNPCNWDTDRYKYRSFCSSKCAQQNDGVKIRRATTNIEKFGVENPLKDPTVRQRANDTLFRLHGVRSPIHSPEIRQKIITTNVEKYGVEFNCVSDNNTTKRRETNVDKYGFEFPFQSPEVQQKVTDTVVDRYGVVSTALVPEIRQRQDDTKLVTYRNKFPFYDLVRDRTFITQEYVDNEKTQKQISMMVGCSQETISNRMKELSIDVIPKSSSTIEQEIVDFLSSFYAGTIIRHDRRIIAPLELDIVLPELKIAIEVNGVFWHSELQGKHRNYHANKTKRCNESGFQLIHITDVQWLSKRSIVESRLRSKIGHTPKILYARNLHIVELDGQLSGSFFEDNHIQGDSTSSIRYGLVSSCGELQCAMSFGRCRYSSEYDYELIRFASKLNTSVVGGASRLFQHFVRNVRCNVVVSYCDLSWNTGDVYSQLGFKLSHISPPNYKYFHTNAYTKLFSRERYQKHKISKILTQYDPNLSEWQNMVNNGYNRIWDCGNSVWVYTT